MNTAAVGCYFIDRLAEAALRNLVGVPGVHVSALMEREVASNLPFFLCAFPTFFTASPF
jgi:hypothetical protein